MVTEHPKKNKYLMKNHWTAGQLRGKQQVNTAQMTDPEQEETIMKTTFKVALSITAGLAAASSSMAAPRLALDIRPLADAREALTPEEYTADDRELVAKQALLFIENLYVHRELKVKDFGAQSDPVPRLKNMVKRARTMSDADFHVEMQKIFLDLHDHHTNYSAPLPLQCSYVLSPLHFADVYDQGSLKVIVNGTTKVLQDIVGSDIEDVLVGDELLSINGKAIAEVLEDGRRLSGGANEDAMTAGAVMGLSMIPLAEQPVPEADTLTYEFRRGSKKFVVNTSYYALVNIPSCVQSIRGSSFFKKFKTDKNPKRKAGFDLEGALVRGENPKIRDYKELVLPDKVSVFGDEGKLPIGQFYTIDTPAGRLAKFDLETFMPEGNASPDNVIHQVKLLLEKAKETSEALIIDMRGNGGGYILLAEGLTQLFTPNKIETMPVRLLPNKLNLNTFLNSNQGRENGWSQDTREGIAANARYTNPRRITSSDAANRYGQVWFKPVVVLTDANCYSACDLFAGAMQDHGAATIIGTHTTTGAGGANVMDYDTFRQIFNQSLTTENPFIALPGYQSMRVSWRQTLRVGKNQGKLIEDAGIKSDIVVRYVTEDVVGGESRVLMKKIHEAIKKIIPRYKSNITLRSSLMMANGQPAKWVESVRGVDKIEVVQSGRTIASYDLETTQSDLTISLKNSKGAWSDAAFDVIGTLNGETQFRVVREVRWRGDALDASEGLSESFTGTLDYWHAQQLSGPDGEGWQAKGDTIGVGSGDKYSPNTSTQLFNLISTKDKNVVLLDIGMILESEDEMDYLNIIVRDPVTDTEIYLASLSGTLNLDSRRPLQLPTAGMEQMEIVLEFMSDENWNMKGPEISRLTIMTK
jgi:hypothetical protein